MGGGIIWCPHCQAPHVLGTKICPTTAKPIERGIHTQPTIDRQHPLIGTVVANKYRVDRLIGRGGLSEVFEAEDTFLRRIVALKIVRATASRDAALRLQREAQLVAAVHHPNICDVYDAGLLPDGAPFMILERLLGETLSSQRRQSRVLSVVAVADIFSQILSGLSAAHGANIVHRDLKPQNVFLVDRLGLVPIVKLLDFGFAKDLSGGRGRSITTPGTAVGTLSYMSPEQLRGEGSSTRHDLFAVGVMLYEALTGKHPFGGDTLIELKTNLLKCEPARPSEICKDLPPAVEAVVIRALANDPAERWQSAQEFQQALSAAATPALRRWNETPPSTTTTTGEGPSSQSSQSSDVAD